MEKLKEYRKELCITQKRVAEYIKITTGAYEKIEKRGCKDGLKKQIIMFLMMECNTDNVSKKRIADLLGIHRSNLSKYKGDINIALEKDKQRRIEIKEELRKLL